jgi:hypothetical protein
MMSAVRRLIPLLPLLALSLGGCSTKNIPLLTADATPKKPVVRPTEAPTAMPLVLSTGFDQFAGNCPDAAVEDTALISYATTQNYNLDMQLQVTPTQGCDADPKSQSYKTFIRQVGQAKLTVNDLDGQLAYGYVATRETFTTNLFAQLQAHYPSLAKVTITVIRGGHTFTVLSYDGHGQPQMSELYGQ